MTRLMLSTLATASLAFAAPALAGDRTFTHDGITYTYTSTKVDGAIVIEGTARPIGGKFRFVVRDGKVSGYAGGVRVAFLVKDALKLRGEVAER